MIQTYIFQFTERQQARVNFKHIHSTFKIAKDRENESEREMMWGKRKGVVLTFKHMNER